MKYKPGDEACQKPSYKPLPWFTCSWLPWLPSPGLYAWNNKMCVELTTCLHPGLCLCSFLPHQVRHVPNSFAREKTSSTCCSCIILPILWGLPALLHCTVMAAVYIGELVGTPLPGSHEATKHSSHLGNNPRQSPNRNTVSHTLDQGYFVGPAKNPC